MPESPEKTGVLKKALGGGKWLTLGYASERALGLFSFLILARLLTPQDFGVMAIVLAAPKLLQAATESGLAAAATQRGGDIRRYLNPLWSLQVAKSALIASAIFFLGPLLASFFRLGSAVAAIRLGGVFIFIQNLANIGEIYFVKNLDFKKVFLRNLIKQAAYVAAAVGSAFVLRSYWALMTGTVFLYSAEALSTYALHPYRPRFTLRWGPLRELVGFGKWIVGQGLIDQAYGASETAIIGKLAGVTQIGYYTKAKSLAVVVPGILSSAINQVSFPAYAKLKEYPEKVSDGFKKTLHLMSFALSPVAAAILIAGGMIVKTLLGEAWLPMAPALQIAAFYYAALTINDIAYRLLSGIGHPEAKVKLDAVKLGLTVALLLVLVPRYGIAGGAWALLLGVLPSFILNLRELSRRTALSPGDIFASVWVPTVAIIMIAAPFLAVKIAIANLSPLAWAGLGALALAGYCALIWAAGAWLKRGPYETLRFALRYTL